MHAWFTRTPADNLHAMRPRTVLLLSLCLLTFAPPATARAANTRAAADSSQWTTLGRRQPWEQLALQRRFGVMDSLAQALLAKAVARGERDSSTLAALLTDAVEAASLAGRAREDEPAAQLQRAQAIRRAIPGLDSLPYARALRVSSEFHRRRREFVPALDEANASLRIYSRALSPDHIEVGAALRQVAIVGSVLQRGAWLAEARRAVDVARRYWADDDPHLLPYWSVLSSQQNLAGDQVGSLASTQRVLAGLEASLPADHPDVSQSRYNVAVVSMRVGDLVRATDLLARVLEVETSRARPDSGRIATSASAGMECLSDLGDFAGARSWYERYGWAFAFHRRTDDPERYSTLHEVARVFAATGRAQEAVALFDSTIAFEARHNDSTTAVPILFERAGAMRAAGDSAGALATVRLAGAIADRAGDRAPSFFEGGLMWGRVLNDAGRPREALARLEGAMDRTIALLGEGSTLEAKLLHERARALVMMRDPGAFAMAMRSAKLRAELLRTGARGFPDRLALVYQANLGNGLDPLLALAADGALADGQRRAVLDQVVEARSMVLDEVARRQRDARASRDPEMAALLDSLAEARAVLARRLVRGEPGAAVDSLHRVMRERVEHFERALAGRGVARADSGTRSPFAELGPGDALVSFVEYATAAARPERRLVAFVTRRGAAPAAVPLGRAAEIAALVQQWRADAVGSGAMAETRARASGAKLRARVWDPLAAAVTGATRLLVVPDGALQLVDFAALPGARDRWLAETLPPLVRLGAERDLETLDDTDSSAGSLVAFGGADFDGAPELVAASREAAAADGAPRRRGEPVACAQFRQVRFAPLPGTAQEAEQVAQSWRSGGRVARAVTGASATEGVLRHELGGASALHLATHGFFVANDCGVTTGARGIGGLAPAVAAQPAAAADVAEPLRLAGLAFAGANHRDDAPGGDDGILTAEEISSLDLSGIREVVLSACDTGLGDIAAGEGVIGLQRAFRVAGARALVMSLWPVDDLATRDWMRAYYEARATRGMGIAASVRAAQLARLAALRAARLPAPPSAWAGFIGLGD
ncbi:MAG: CHAT domain-containing tetratricopeptide repeat protein [Candidatus Eisenbacteria bacterium]